MVKNGIIPYFVYDMSISIDFDLGNRKKKTPKRPCILGQKENADRLISFILLGNLNI